MDYDVYKFAMSYVLVRWKQRMRERRPLNCCFYIIILSQRNINNYTNLILNA